MTRISTKILYIFMIFLFGFGTGIYYQKRIDTQYYKQFAEGMQRQYLRLNQSYQSMRTHLEPLKKIAGLTDLTGEGLVMVLTPRYPTVNISEKKLTNLLNYLWINGAKALSVNNLRVNINSKIYKKNQIIFINQTPITYPITLNILEQTPGTISISGNNNLLKELKESKIKISLFSQHDLVIPADKSFFSSQEFERPTPHK